jgi:hypothetical protein
VLGLALGAAYVDRGRDTWRSGLYGFQQPLLDAALEVRTATPPDARIGSFNAGTMAFYSDRTVVNLDGVVNPDAYDALRDHRLLDYTGEAGVTHIADYDNVFKPRAVDWDATIWGADPNAAFTPMTAFGTPNIFGQVRLWRADDAATSRPPPP